MGNLVAIGEPGRVRGFALAGAIVLVAEDAETARASWRSMPDDTDVVILTPAAASALAQMTDAPNAPLVAVLPGGDR